MKRARHVAAAVLMLGLGYQRSVLAAPKGISSCKTISAPGSYVLSGNLTAAGTCLLLSADFVTIDLGGFSITGNGTGDGVGDGGVAHQGIAIRNGTISNFDKGVGLLASSEVEVTQVHLTGNSSYGVQARDSAVVTDCIITGNGVQGIFLVEFAQVRGNTVNGNGTGIGTGSAALIINNSASGNTVGGGIGCTVGCSLIGNTARLNATAGISVASGATLVNNTTNVNGGIGINVICPGNVFANTSTNNTGGNLVTNTMAGPCNVEHNLTP